MSKLLAAITSVVSAIAVFMVPVAHASEAELILPDFRSATFMWGIDGHTLLLWGMLVSALGMLFGLVMFTRVKKLPVHKAMKEISELIYETCKTYLITQGKFLMILEAFIGIIIVAYFGYLRHFEALRVLTILLFSVIGIL